MRRTMKRIISITLVIVVLINFLAACAAPVPTEVPVINESPATEAPDVLDTAVPSAEPAAKTITVTDALGRTVEFDQLPSRIMIVGKAAFMLLDAAYLFPEAPERIIAYELRSQTGLDFVKTVFTGDGEMTVIEQDSGPEQIAPLNPDLVMMKAYLKDQLGDQVEKLGIKVVYLDLETPEQINKDIQTLGQIFGNEARADELTAQYDHAMKKVTDATASLTDEEKPSVLVLMYSDKGGEVAFSYPTMNYFQSQLVEIAGGVPVWKDLPADGWTIVTIEQIAAWNPDATFIIHYQGKAVEVVENLKTDANWMLLDAVKNDRLYAFPLDFQSWDQPDTRWTLGLAWMAAKLHPDLFPSFDLLEEAKAFYRDFYGLNDLVITEKIVPLIKGNIQ